MQAHEIRAARSYPECRGLTSEQLEDIYQETAVALLSRPYLSEDHYATPLRTGVKHRALNLHRNERRRGRPCAIAPGMYVTAQAQEGPGRARARANVHQDRLVVLGVS